VFEAAAAEGIRRVVQASSINALGFYFGVKPFSLHYFPVDEAHPTYTTDSYSFSKQIVEEIADYYWRRERISSVSLRLPLVVDRRDFAEDAARQWLAASQAICRSVLELEPDAQRERVHSVIQTHEAQRAARTYEQSATLHTQRDPTSVLVFERANFWTILDARDAAQAVDKGLTADYDGSHAIYVNDNNNVAGLETERMVQVFYPDVTARKRALCGTEALVDITKAKALIGFWPEHSAINLLPPTKAAQTETS